MLQPSTLTYITNLTNNNNKPWFEENRFAFNEAKEDFEKLVKNIIAKFGEIDPDIAPLEAKNCIFRQYRDVRFSKDKTPYKQHMGASFDRGGKKSGFAGYYLHIQPGNKSMAGGGIWMPEGEQLKKRSARKLIIAGMSSAELLTTKSLKAFTTILNKANLS